MGGLRLITYLTRPKFIGVLLLSLMAGSRSFSQITAQGQGGNDVLWTAIGLEQTLNNHWLSKTMLAYSRHSSMDSWNFVEQPGILAAGQEFLYRLNKRFKVSMGGLYVRRKYADNEHPSIVNEKRLYPKLHHNFALGKVKFSQYMRCDFRFFSIPHAFTYSKPFEFRNRYRIKAEIPLDSEQKNQLIGITEFFFAKDKNIEIGGKAVYSSYMFTENRSSVFFRHHFFRYNFFFDLGIMNQFWQKKKYMPFHETVLLQLDLIAVNPFKRLK